MKLFVPPEIDRYAREHTSERPALFDELRSHTYATFDNPQMQVGRVEGMLLKLLVALCGAKRVLEIGTFTGYSALCMAEALPADGELITCDHNEEHVAAARSFFERSPHGHKITIRLGDALDTVVALDDKPFDLVFIDADKARYLDYYEQLLPRLRTGGLLVADNVLWSGEVLDPSSDDARGIVAMNERVQSDDRVDNVLLPVRDGLMLARKL